MPDTVTLRCAKCGKVLGELYAQDEISCSVPVCVYNSAYPYAGNGVIPSVFCEDCYKAARGAGE